MRRRRDAAALLLAMVLSLATAVSAAAAPLRLPLPGSPPPAFTRQAPSVAPVAPAARMDLTVWLRPADEAALTRAAEVAAAQNGATVQNLLSPSQFDSLYAPSATTYAAVRSYLTGQGLSIAGTVPNRLLLSVSGTAAQVEAAFGVTLRQYRLQGRTVIANADTPTLPAALSGAVAAVGGLDGAAIPRPQVHVLGRGWPFHARQGAPGAQLCGALAPNDGETVAGATYVPCPYAPAALAAAIHLGSAPSPLALRGQGQTIALIDAYGSPTLRQDLAAFDATFHLPPVSLRQIGRTTFSAANPDAAGWSVETSLDVEWAHALAPGARILLYVAPDASDLLQTLDEVVATRPARLVSLSWGFYESQAPAAELQAVDVLFAAAAAEGIGVAAAAGDCGNGVACAGTPTVEYPASSPFVTAVGGVSLLPGQAGAPLVTPWGTVLCAEVTETANGVPACPSQTFLGGGGGGSSAVFASPPWQLGFTGSQTRAVPDVSLDADPFTGVWVAVGGGFVEVGGTSAAAPVFTGLMALANQAAGRPLGLVAPALYVPAVRDAINAVGAGTAGPLLYASPTTGNLYQVRFGYDYGLRAGPGWNSATGLGLPNATALVQALARLR